MSGESHEFAHAFESRDRWMTRTFELCRPVLRGVQELRGTDVHINESYVPDGKTLFITFQRTVEEAPSLCGTFSLTIPVELVCRGTPAELRQYLIHHLVTLAPSP